MTHEYIRHTVLIVLLSLLAAPALFAQTDEVAATHRVSVDEAVLNDTCFDRPLPLAGEVVNRALDCPYAMPALSIGGYGLGGFSPYGSPTLDSSWRLHEGFNAQFGLSMSTGLSKHSPRGVGFGQAAAFAYVVPITSKLSVAAGIYANNWDWGSWHRTDVGIAGVVAYEVNERISLYAYGSKSFLPRLSNQTFRRDPFPAFLEHQRDRIGAAAEFKIGQNAMIGISVEHSSY